MRVPKVADIRRANEVACIQAWRLRGKALTIAELAQQAGLSRPTVEAVVADLIDRGLVQEHAAEGDGATLGRPARRFDFDPTSRLVAGIDAAPTSIRVALADMSGRILTLTDRPLQGSLTAGQRLNETVKAVRESLQRIGLPASRLAAACIGVSGIVRHDGKISRSYYVPEWNNTDVARVLSERLDCAVLLENDIKLAAYAEHHMGTTQLVRNSVYFQLGERISFAVTLNGRILQGAHRTAGELASLRGMRWTSNSVKGQLLWKSAGSFAGVMELAEQGDPDAAQEIDTFASDIAYWIAAVSLVVDPDVVLLGGEFAQAPGFPERLRRQIDHMMLVSEKPDVLPSSLGGDGTLLGTVALAFHECSETLFGVAGVPVPEIVKPDGAEFGTEPAAWVSTG